MAATPFRPPWFGNVAVQGLAAIAVLYNLYRLVDEAIDGDYGEAFLSFAWTVLFGYVLLESYRTRKAQRAQAQVEADESAEPPA
jgi:hypothetical protein